MIVPQLRLKRATPRLLPRPRIQFCSLPDYTSSDRPMSTSSRPPAATVSEFLEQVRGELRLRRDSLRTEESYLQYIRRFLEFHNRRETSTSSFTLRPSSFV